MVLDRLLDVGRTRDCAHNFSADGRVHFDDRVLVVGERPIFGNNALRHEDFAHIMDARRIDKLRHLVRRQRKRTADQFGAARDHVSVAGCVELAGLGGARDLLDGFLQNLDVAVLFVAAELLQRGDELFEMFRTRLLTLQEAFDVAGDLLALGGEIFAINEFLGGRDAIAARVLGNVHGSVVSVTTYRDAGFLPEAFINFLCLLGWSPKNDREQMSLKDLVEVFSLEGINRANAVVNFKEPAATPEETFDPKAVWLNAEHLRALPVEELSTRLLPIVQAAGYRADAAKMLKVTPLIRERIRLLNDVLTAADFFFVDQLPPFDTAELIPQKGDAGMAKRVLAKGLEVLTKTEFTHDGLDQSLRAAAQELGVKAGQMFQPIRVAVCGRKNAPPLFETLEVLGRETTLKRVEQALQKVQVSGT